MTTLLSFLFGLASTLTLVECSERGLSFRERAERLSLGLIMAAIAAGLFYGAAQ